MKRTAHSRTPTQRTSGETVLGVQERAKRAAAKDARFAAQPHYGFDGSARSLRSGGRAAAEDQNTREKWGLVVRSAYIRAIDIPDEVRAADYSTAGAILRRIETALDRREECACWTETERARLRKMHKAWTERAAGRDIKFNVRGWRRKLTGDAKQQAEERQLTKFVQLVKGIEETLDGR